MNDRPAAAPLNPSHADLAGVIGDDPGPDCLDIPDTGDANPARYAGPRPGDGPQTAPQDRFAVPGSPTGPNDRLSPGPERPDRYRKRPAVIEAIRWTPDSTAEVKEFLGAAYLGDLSPGRIRIETAEGPIPAATGDWIIRGVAGEFYPCRGDIFEATYEPTDEPLTSPPPPRGQRGRR